MQRITVKLKDEGGEVLLFICPSDIRSYKKGPVDNYILTNSGMWTLADDESFETIDAQIEIFEKNAEERSHNSQKNAMQEAMDHYAQTIKKDILGGLCELDCRIEKLEEAGIQQTKPPEEAS